MEKRGEENVNAILWRRPAERGTNKVMSPRVPNFPLGFKVSAFSGNRGRRNEKQVPLPQNSMSWNRNRVAGR